MEDQGPLGSKANSLSPTPCCPSKRFYNLDKDKQYFSPNVAPFIGVFLQLLLVTESLHTLRADDQLLTPRSRISLGGGEVSKISGSIDHNLPHNVWSLLTISKSQLAFQRGQCETFPPKNPEHHLPKVYTESRGRMSLEYGS